MIKNKRTQGKIKRDYGMPDYYKYFKKEHPELNIPNKKYWVATNKLWNEDEEAKEKKLLVRFTNYHTSKYVFFVYFKKYVYPFKNKKYFKFKTTRSLARMLGKRIKDENKDKYDAFLLY